MRDIFVVACIPPYGTNTGKKKRNLTVDDWYGKEREKEREATCTECRYYENRSLTPFGFFEIFSFIKNKSSNIKLGRMKQASRGREKEREARCTAHDVGIPKIDP